jgi:DNA (cytosine-5)-methyltransferase 1
MNVLNLYAGLGGNRKLWKNVDVVAIESDPKIAAVYEKLHPEDDVFVEDAHTLLLDVFDQFDFIWSRL